MRSLRHRTISLRLQTSQLIWEISTRERRWLRLWTFLVEMRVRSLFVFGSVLSSEVSMSSPISLSSFLLSQCPMSNCISLLGLATVLVNLPSNPLRLSHLLNTRYLSLHLLLYYFHLGLAAQSFGCRLKRRLNKCQIEIERSRRFYRLKQEQGLQLDAFNSDKPPCEPKPLCDAPLSPICIPQGWI